MKPEPRDANRKSAGGKDRPFVAIVLILVLLLAAAIWQFYSLAWGDVLTGSSSVRSIREQADRRT
jgi:hypothetical protein